MSSIVDDQVLTAYARSAERFDNNIGSRAQLRGGGMAIAKNRLAAGILIGVSLFGVAAAADTAPKTPSSTDSDTAQIRALFADLMRDVEKQDAKGVASHYAPKGFMYLDVSTPRAFYGREGGVYTWNAYFGLCVPGSIKAEATDLHVTVAGDGKYAFAYHFDRYRAKLTNPSISHLEDITNRATSFLEKIDGKWYIKLEHNSFPVDLATGKPDWVSKDVRDLPHP